jgi:LmbE family N-acetylglucosaminyl deacetylase
MLTRSSVGVAAGLALVAASPVLVGSAASPASLSVDFSERTRLMVVAPHPDDETLGAAGLIQRVLENGGQALVVLVTSGDGFPEGVEIADRISNPKPRDYRNYGKEREQESATAMKNLGLPRAQVRFLGFPDGGLCLLASKYLSSKGHAFESWYTDRTRPPAPDEIIPGVTYKGESVRAEIERLLVEFAPTIVAVTHSEDEHPDHCATYVFVREALDAIYRTQPTLSPRVLYYLVHSGQWPLNSAGTALEPPEGFPPDAGHWSRLDLTPDEVARKRGSLFAYSTQIAVIGRFLLSFSRDNELFIEGTPSAPECWCDGENVATEVPPANRRRQPSAPR